MEEERRNIQKVIDEVSHAHRSFRPGGGGAIESGVM